MTKRIVTVIVVCAVLAFMSSLSVQAATIKATTKDNVQEVTGMINDKIDVKDNGSENSAGENNNSESSVSQSSNNSQKNNSSNKSKKKKKKKSKKKYTKKDLRLMTSIIFCEARGECYAGQKAVGIVVMNRVRSKRFPNTIKKVIYQRGQFTPTRNGSMRKALAIYDRYNRKGKFKGEMKSCYKAAKEVLAGETTIKVRGKKKNMKNYLFFSQYVAGAKYTLGCHQFK